MRSTSSTSPRATHASAAVKPAFSHVINGIRGLALTMVVAFHLFGHGRVSGGVDVFLVISAYLMTGSLARSLHRGHFSLTARYTRTFVRLTPAALLAIVVTVAAGMFVLPRSRWEGLFEQASAAASFRENAYLAAAEMSYGAAGDGASPFQHFWSLSVQAQFFLLWPLVALILMLLFGRARPQFRTVVFALLTALMTVVSFMFAARFVAADQTLAYYSLPARLWEFGLGGLAYFWGRNAKHFPRAGAVLGWVGVALILSSGFVVNGGELFPGPWTLWPVAGTLMVIFASDSGGAGRLGLTAILSLPPVRWLASLGYALYLWHWPILVLYLEHRAQENVGWKDALGVLLVSLVLAEGTNRFVTAPLVSVANARSGTRSGLAATAFAVSGAIAVVSGMFALAAWHEGELQRRELEAILDAEQDAVSVGKGPEHPGALALAYPQTYGGPWDSTPLPSPAVAQKDGPAIDAFDCVTGVDGSEVQICEDHPGTGASAPAEDAKTVALVGGSHDVQYYDALRQIADENGWELLVIGKQACRFSVPDSEHKLSEQCYEWNEQAMKELLRLHPDAVFTLSTVTRPGGVEAPEMVYQGQIDAWKELGAEGIHVIGLRDNPRFSWKAPECLESNADASACSVSRSDIYAGDFAELLSGAPTNVTPIDTSGWFCDAELCEPIVGNVLVYRDQGHFTATYARSLAPILAEALRQEAPFLFEE